ncbi:putative bifunctional diguanylate cyclase/phosphodiesterase [Deinococcus sp. A31D244]|uniref:putative bifunctional diguanylate cyclase/phosphodiesterase n=1 Tax=Deinococcus sp. A31D244 TaxID=3397675 RepID=UPI0039DF7B9C
MILPAPRPVPRGTGLAALGLGAGYLLHLMHLAGWTSTSPEWALGPYLLVFLGSAALIWSLAARTEAPGAWRWLAAGTFCWGVGNALYTLGDVPAGVLGFTDPWFLALPACMLVAFWLFERRWPSLPSREAQLDVAAQVMSVGAYLWFFVLAEQMRRADHSLLSNLVAALYPLSDLVLLSLLLAQTWRGPDGAPRGMGFLAAGMVCFVVADTGYTILALRDTYAGNMWPDALWPLAALLFVAGAWQAGQPRPLTVSPPRRPRSLWYGPLAPYSALLAGFMLLGAVRLPLEARGALYATFFAAIFVAARQTLTLRQLEDSRARLEFQSRHDALTGLGNRRQLHLTLDARLRGPEGTGLLIVDLDDFRFVNEALGHRAGDTFLQRTAATLRSEAAALNGECFHLSADEFVVIVPAARDEQVNAAGEALLRALRVPVTLEGQVLNITASVGAALAPVNGPLDGAALLRRADLAMKEAKRTGRNALQLFDPLRDDAAAARRVTIETRLRGAAERGELQLHYQPQLERGGQRVHFEALLRWQDAQLGAVSPAEFVPVAEVAGLMVDLDRWVIAQACRQLAGWRAAGRPWQVAVNISPPNLVRPDFLPFLLRQHGLPHAALSLEVTERLLIENEAQARQTLQALMDLGIEVAVDDFGVGQSSLSSLLRLPISVLKVDRAFVTELTGDRADGQAAFKVVQAVVGLGRALNLRVVAEGVETPEQAQLLWELGVDALQGYWIGRATPPDAVAGTVPTGAVPTGSAPPAPGVA